MISEAVLDAMVSAGCTREQIVAAVKADLRELSETAAERREKDRIRKREQRAREKEMKSNVASDMSRGQPVTACDSADKKENSPTPPKRKTKNPPSGVKKAKLPDDFRPAESLVAKHTELGWSKPAIDYQIGRMRNWATANSIERSDWNAQLRNWLDGAVEKYRGQGPDPRTYAPAGSPLLALAQRPAGWPPNLPDPERVRTVWFAGNWPGPWGPRPDQDGCMVPAEILQSWASPARHVA